MQTIAAEFTFKVEQETENYLEVRLDASEGPVGTRDYGFLVEAIPLDGGKTFLHLAYSYALGLSSRLATELYLATTGWGKVGFTVTGTAPDGEPEYIGGLRGAVERNAMRYYLAIDAYLGAFAASEKERFEKSLERWFDSIDQYPRQLKEADRAAYFAIKRRRYEGQRTEQ